jgi:hypothetical protein
MQRQRLSFWIRLEIRWRKHHKFGCHVQLPLNCVEFTAAIEEIYNTVLLF